jgi:lysophospholipase L1-like esterase
MLLENGCRLVMLGDSVTDCGRSMPVGDGLYNETGYGYVSLIQASLTAVYPDKGVRVINMGTSGDTVRELKARWDRDVVVQKPDWLSVMVGINDVWRQFDAPFEKEKHVYLEEYAQTLEELVNITKPMLKGLVLMTPYYIEPNTADSMRAAMDRYGLAVKGIAEKHGTYFIDTQAAFNNALAVINSNAFSRDRVHPNMSGHTILAREFLKVIEF